MRFVRRGGYQSHRGDQCRPSHNHNLSLHLSSLTSVSPRHHHLRRNYLISSDTSSPTTQFRPLAHKDRIQVHPLQQFHRSLHLLTRIDSPGTALATRGFLVSQPIPMSQMAHQSDHQRPKRPNLRKAQPSRWQVCPRPMRERIKVAGLPNTAFLLPSHLFYRRSIYHHRRCCFQTPPVRI
jgi:hypothetical protein